MTLRFFSCCTRFLEHCLYGHPERHNAQRQWDTDRRTDRRQYDANSRSYCVPQYDDRL